MFVHLASIRKVTVRNGPAVLAVVCMLFAVTSAPVHAQKSPPTVLPGCTLGNGEVDIPTEETAQTTNELDLVGDVGSVRDILPIGLPGSQALMACTLQSAASRASGLASGAALGGMIGDAVGSAFSPGFGLSSSGDQQAALSTSGTAPPPGMMTLGARGNGRPSYLAPIGPTTHIWGEVKITGGDDDAAGGYDFLQFNGAAGAYTKITENLVAGVLVAYEDFRYEIDANPSQLDGNGYSFGAYIAFRPVREVRIDAGTVHTWLDYDVAAVPSNGDFDSARWFYFATLTGTTSLGDVTVEPSASIVWLSEDQDAYVDSLGTGHPSNDFTAGRASFGASVTQVFAVTSTLAPDLILVPYIGLYADYYFSSEEALVATVPTFGISEDWSARVKSGIVLSSPKTNAWSLNLGGELGNLGGDEGLIYAGRLGGSVRF